MLARTAATTCAAQSLLALRTSKRAVRALPPAACSGLSGEQTCIILGQNCVPQCMSVHLWQRPPPCSGGRRVRGSFWGMLSVFCAKPWAWQQLVGLAWLQMVLKSRLKQPCDMRAFCMSPAGEEQQCSRRRCSNGVESFPGVLALPFQNPGRTTHVCAGGNCLSVTKCASDIRFFFAVFLHREALGVQRSSPRWWAQG